MTQPWAKQRDEEAKRLADEVTAPEIANYVTRRALYERLVKAGYDFGRSSLSEELGKVKAALEFYAKGRHFHWCGRDEWEPETVSGEPTNWKYGGGPGSEFEHEDGWGAREALALLEGLGIK